jgi:hypothetical protein
MSKLSKSLNRGSRWVTGHETFLKKKPERETTLTFGSKNS